MTECSDTAPDTSDETWGRLQSALQARRHMLVMLAQWTEEVRTLEMMRYGYPITERTEVVTDG